MYLEPRVFQQLLARRACSLAAVRECDEPSGGRGNVVGVVCGRGGLRLGKRTSGRWGGAIRSCSSVSAPPAGCSGALCGTSCAGYVLCCWGPGFAGLGSGWEGPDAAGEVGATVWSRRRFDGADGVGVELAGEVSNAASYSLFNAAGAGEEGREGDGDGGWGAQRRRPIKFIQFALQFELFQCSGRSEWLTGARSM